MYINVLLLLIYRIKSLLGVGAAEFGRVRLLLHAAFTTLDQEMITTEPLDTILLSH